MPLLILHGGADRQALPEASRRFFEQVPLTDKELHVYPGAYHILDWETNRDEVFADCLEWLDRHVPHSASADLRTAASRDTRAGGATDIFRQAWRCRGA